MDEKNIIIKQSYFTNIKVAIDSINAFFASEFKTKNFPILDEGVDLDPTIERIMNRLNSVDPSWVYDENKFQDMLNTINAKLEKIDPEDGIYQSIIDSNNETLITAVDSYVGFKVLNMIADNFDAFNQFINGLYTFEIFYKPSAYAEALNIFDQYIQFDEVPTLDLEEKIFDDTIYVDGVFRNPDISIPDELTEESETERISARTDLEGYEILVDDSVQEAAEINFFEADRPKNMRYSDSQKKYLISNEFTSAVDELIAGLRKCDTTDDLLNFFRDSSVIPKLTDRMSRTVIPYILVRVLTNPKKTATDLSSVLKKYTDSYASILSQNNGARRFENYDLFSTFKSDKEGTIKFIEDFCKLKLVNDSDASIANNTLLTIFNIFDSRIYLDLVYNVSPESLRNEKGEDAFVKEIRARINKNSRTKNAYTEEEPTSTEEVTDVEGTPTETKPDTTETVTEYVSRELKKFGKMSHNDMMYCDQFCALVNKEIETLDDRIYNEHLSPILIEEYIGESYDVDVLKEFYMEASVPQRRIRLQSAYNSLMHDCEQIVKMNKQHRWNNNVFARQFTTTTSMFVGFLCPNINGSSESHTNIKQLHHWLRKAVNGKAGSFNNEQIKALHSLYELVADMWVTVKLFWVNPRNWFKKAHLSHNTGIQRRVTKMAELSEQIVALKPQLEFLNDEKFINEHAFMEQFTEEFIMEATTEKNHARLNTAVTALMEDMKQIVGLVKRKQWTNNTMLSMFRMKKIKVDLSEAKKYVGMAIGGSGGISMQNVDVMKDLEIKIKDIISTVKSAQINPLIRRNVKESEASKKVAMLASEILKLESSLGFLKDSPVKDRPKKDDEKSDEKQVSESVVMDLDDFIVAMEGHAMTGELPGYMKTRIHDYTDTLKTNSPTPVELPDGVPQNPIPDLVDSINTKVNTNSDDLNDILGSGFNPNGKGDGKIVVNITNNYTNSFNKDSNNTTTNDDHSTGKVTNITNTNSNNDSSTNKDSSRNKRTTSSNSNKTDKSGSNNNNNSSTSADTTKDSKEKKFSNGKTVQEMFMFLESKEPRSDRSGAGNPPDEDLLTKAMDKDRKSLPKQQEAKRKVNKSLNTGKAVLRPISRTKQWLADIVESVTKRDEDKVKAEMLDNESYRSAVFKAARIATKLGLTSVLYALNPYLGVGYAGVQGLKAIDKHRLQKEFGDELLVELDVIDQKIRDLGNSNDPEALKQKYELMRLRQKMIHKIPSSQKSFIKRPSEIA